MNLNTSSSAILDLNLSDIIEDIFMVLSEKEKEVVIRRFSLNNKSKQTLETIGKSFNVTRERVRQIEKIALTKLRRTVSSTKLRFIHDLALAILNENGGVMEENRLVEMILSSNKKNFEADPHIVRLSLAIHQDLDSIEKNGKYRLSWHLKTIDKAHIMSALEAAIAHLKSAKSIQNVSDLVKAMKKEKSLKSAAFEDEFFASLLTIDIRMKQVEEGFGLMTWRHINPKSIRDKALIVLRNEGKPLHFNEIAKKITEADFDKKKMTIQAVHNELIRDELFVLVGRGLYALKEWGYMEGTVTDIIEALLKKKSPMSKKDIIRDVLKQRQVKKGTISLNLQKNPQFVRVGRAVYAYDESLKQ